MNDLILNTGELNAGTPVPTAEALADFDALEFDGYSLQPSDGSVVSELIDAYGGPTRETPFFRIPRYDGGAFVGDYFRERRVRVRGIIKAATAAALEAALDTFKRRLSLAEGNLDLKPAGATEVRRIRATLANTDVMFGRREGWHITTCPFDLEFLALEPMWHGLEYQSDLFSSVSSLAYSNAVTNDGTYKAQPVLVVIVNAASGVTAFEFENTTTGESISVTTALAAGDVLIIDSEAKSVTKNGTEIDYTGTFPALAYGDNTFTLTTTGTSITYDATLKHKKTFI